MGVVAFETTPARNLTLVDHTVAAILRSTSLVQLFVPMPYFPRVLRCEV
jgi:hypothetical protein